MGSRDLLADLADAGLAVSAHDGRLIVRPASRLTDDLREAVRSAKTELLARLTGKPALGLQGDAHVGTWTEANMQRFLDRRGRLLRWGWAEVEAERMAERLTLADMSGDDRVVCTDCKSFQPWRCANHRAARVGSPDLPRALATLPQRCPGFTHWHRN